MLRDFRLAAAQFAPVSMDKEANLATIGEMTAEAAAGGAEMVFFPEQIVAGYNLWHEAGDPPGMPAVEAGRVSPHWSVIGATPTDHAEAVPDGPSTRALLEIARANGVVLGAGLPEASGDSGAYNCYVLVSPGGFIGKYRKSHTIPGTESQWFRKGGRLDVFDLGACRAGVLICYDNHHPEAHRVLAVMGAHLILMPHVTVGRGWWPEQDDAGAREQARTWILTWLRARAFDNSVFCVFVNQTSADGRGPLGCSMVLDPDGHVISEAATIGREIVFADVHARTHARIRHRGHDYLKARRPELYAPLADPLLGLDP